MSELKTKEVIEKDVKQHTKKLGKYDYLPWANAWKEFLLFYPEATNDVERNDKGLPCFGDSDLGYMCFTSVTACGVTKKMYLPVLDEKYNPIFKPTVWDINKTVMRCFVKNLAMFGLGIDLYIGEDFIDNDKSNKTDNELRRSIFNIINNPSVPKKDKEDYKAKLKSKELLFTEELLEKLQITYGVVE